MNNLKKSKRPSTRKETRKVIIHTKELYDAETGEPVMVKSEETMVEEKKESASQGWTMVYYKDYDEILLECAKSIMEIRIILHVRDKFSHKKIDANLSPTEIAKEMKVSVSSIKRVMKRLKSYSFVAQGKDKTYRLNPFIFVPYHSNAIELQNHWRESIE